MLRLSWVGCGVRTAPRSLVDTQRSQVTGATTTPRSPALLALLCALSVASAACASTNVVRGADEIFWVPTLEQALEMAQATGKPLFLMGYSLVGDGSTYTKIADDYCTGVF